ncbi:MAG: putative molybdenum carrier protein [Smithella sp.]
MKEMIIKIISGGQTGADRAALDFAIDNNIPHGGWIPKGRITEGGQLPDKYHLQEMETASYDKRTEQNVIDSDGTVIVSHGDLTGGSALTQTFTIKHHKPRLHLDMDNTTIKEAADSLNNWIRKNNIKILNVAGSRTSKDNNIYHVTREILEAAFIKEKSRG